MARNTAASLALLEAARLGHVPAVEGLLAASDTDPAPTWCSCALVVAAKRGLLSIVMLLLVDGRANPVASDNLAVREAAEDGHAAVVRALLMDGRADPSVWDFAALRVAAAQGHAAVVRALLSDRRVCPAAANAALTSGAARNHPGVVRVLLADGRVDPRAMEQDTFLHFAAAGYVAVVLAVLQDGRVDPAWMATHAPRRASCPHLLAGYCRVIGSMLAAGDLDEAAPSRLASAAWYAITAEARWRRRRPWLRAAFPLNNAMPMCS
jgi:hypothetical protein